jgi:hypothetical protein
MRLARRLPAPLGRLAGALLVAMVAGTAAVAVTVPGLGAGAQLPPTAITGRETGQAGRGAVPESVAVPRHAVPLPANGGPAALSGSASERTYPRFSPTQLAVLEAAGAATPAALEAYLERSGRFLLEVRAGALTGDGTSQLLLVGASDGCASCHAQWLAVWDVGRGVVLWEAEDGVDTIVRVLEGGGFERSDAVRELDRPSCCPSLREVHRLTWNGSGFVASEPQVTAAD